MGINYSINKVNFEYVQNYSNLRNDKHLLINTLDYSKQDCLIQNTIHASKEEEVLNNYLRKDKSIKILIYGENCSDNKVIDKYNQLYKLGFTNLYVYIGGLFEWLLLQDIYGDDEFPTTSKIYDILNYKGKNIPQ
uniref:Rhodanese domain-containing protein n=1 Tax=viral metagenome TaxID=1070528 RepID=A0A6C0DXN1_9ZZZZ